MDTKTVEEKKIQLIKSAMDNNIVTIAKLHQNDTDSNSHPNTVTRTVTATGFRVSGNQFEVPEPVKGKEEPDLGFDNVIKAKEEPGSGFEELGLSQCETRKTCVKKEPEVELKKEIGQEMRIRGALVEDGDFPEDLDWYLVGRTIVNTVSTTKGINKLVDNEIVYFTFPSPGASYKLYSIVRFSTKRCGEIGRLPMDWAKWVNPLVYAKKVKVVGRCIAAPITLSIMQEIVLFVSSIFISVDKSILMFDAPWNAESTFSPLLYLFRYLKIKPYQEADFTPEELYSGRRVLHIEDCDADVVAALPSAKRRRAFHEKKTDEQAITGKTSTAFYASCMWNHGAIGHGGKQRFKGLMRMVIQQD